MSGEVTRRRALAATVGGVTASVAGCLIVSDGDGDDAGEDEVPAEGVEYRDGGYFVSALADPERDVPAFRANDEALALVARTNDEPLEGFTLAQTLETYPVDRDDVWLVGLRSVYVPADEGIGPEDVVSFYEAHLDVLETYPGLRIGGYHFPEAERTISIDLSVALLDVDEATELGEWNRQTSILNPKLALGDGNWEEGTVQTYDGDGVGEPRIEGVDEVAEVVSDLESLSAPVDAPVATTARGSGSRPYHEYVGETGRRLTPERLFHHVRAGAGTVERTADGVVVDGERYVLVRATDAGTTA